jgi:hypothetical protein
MPLITLRPSQKAAFPIAADGPRRDFIVKTGSTHTHQRRRFTRVPFRAAVEIELVPGLQACELVDISLKGALVESDEPWKANPGEECTLVVELRSESEVIRMAGEVAHVEGMRLGLRCTDIDLDSVICLRRLVELNLGSDEAMSRELAAMVNMD